MDRSSLRLFPAVGICCLVLLSLSMIARIDIHSDILFLDALMDDLFIDHGAWSAWRFSPAPSYFPDMLIYGLGYWLFDSASWRIWFVTVVQIVAVAVLADRLALRIRPALAAFGRGLVLAATCGLVAVANHTTTSIGILFNANNIQVPTLMSSLLMLILSIDGIEGRRPRITFAASLVFGALAYASSTLFLLSFTIPCLATLCLLAMSKIDVGETRRALLGTAGAIVASQALGWLLSRALTWNAPLEGRLTLDASRALLAWRHFQDATANIVALDNPWAVGLFVTCLSTWIAACAVAVSWLVAKRSPRASGVEGFVVVFVLCSSITSIGGAILSGGFGDLYGYRYFMTFAAVSVLWAVTRIDRRISTRRPSAIRAACGVVALTVVSLGQTLATPRHDLAEIGRRGAIVRTEEEVARCLDSLVERGVALDTGIADYWYARGVEYQLAVKRRIEPVTPDLSPFFWISSLGPLQHPRAYGIGRYDFAILRRSVPDVMAGYDLSLMRSLMPSGFTTHRCDAADVDIVVYGGDALDKKVRGRFDNFVFRKTGKGELSLTGAEMPSQIGSVDAGAKVVEGGKPGYLIYGPYIALDAGQYRLELRYSASGAAASPAMPSIDVGDFNTPPATAFAKADLRDASNETLRLAFVVPIGGAINVETRVYFAGVGTLRVDELRIIRLE